MILTAPPEIDGNRLGFARVLLVHREIAPRLTLQTVLEAGGYEVDIAASAAEAITKLDENEYQAVLTDLAMESPEAGRRLLAYARAKEYRPATALVTAYGQPKTPPRESTGEQQVSVDADQLSSILGKLAEMIALRATKRAERAVRHAGG